MAQPRDFLIKIGAQPGGSPRALKYDPEFCMKIRLLAQAGEFPEAWAAEIGVSMETMRAWCHRHEDFREAVSVARILLATYWTREIATNRNNPNAKPGMYAFLARRFPAIYGRDPKDLGEWMQSAQDDAIDQPKALDASTVAATSTEALKERLEMLKRRREEDEREDGA